MKKRYVVTLTDEERRSLRALVSSGKRAAGKLTHARILLKADAGRGGPGWTDADSAPKSLSQKRASRRRAG